MKIALFGYGKMGKEIEKVAIERGHTIVLTVEKDNYDLVSDSDLKNANLAIEFSTPDSVIGNIKLCLGANLPVVVGTTGWNEQLPEIRKLTDTKKGSLFYASNFSLGVNLFFKVNAFLAELMNKYENYDVSMEEIHHVHKLDKPSGTAITLANQVIGKIERKNRWSISEKGMDTLFINDRREGEVPGTHIIKYQSEIDDIEIMHKAHNRKGFALGAVVAAEFLIGRQGVFTMDDLL